MLFTATLLWTCALVFANPADDLVDDVLLGIKPKIILAGLEPAFLDRFQIQINSTWLPKFVADFKNSSVSGLSLLRRKEPCEFKNSTYARAYCVLTTCDLEASLRASVKGDRLSRSLHDIVVNVTFVLPKIGVAMEGDHGRQTRLLGTFIDDVIPLVAVEGQLDLNKNRKKEFLRSLQTQVRIRLNDILWNRYGRVFRDELQRLNSTLDGSRQTSEARDES
ncbi:uncharacterized protein LOC100904636 [Galendromus occidentalis]|uniref:Uncharacterized protein LOC100904636 n=1 Tax=Galendromus occidentalis TaxID=34638 RepID=A0AAJ6QM95_9ACAR|nr:uncharacterized protein LOC100904636 [Galendromus occidentalis]